MIKFRAEEKFGETADGIQYVAIKEGQHDASVCFVLGDDDGAKQFAKHIVDLLNGQVWVRLVRCVLTDDGRYCLLRTIRLPYPPSAGMWLRGYMNSAERLYVREVSWNNNAGFYDARVGPPLGLLTVEKLKEAHGSGWMYNKSI